MVSYFFYFIFFFFINNIWWWCWFHMLFLNWSSLHCVSKSLLNTLWIVYLSSNSSWNAFWLIFFVILKGLYLFWFSFLDGHFNWIFLASSHMLSPSFSSCKFCLFLSNYLFMASFAIFIDLFAAFQLLCNPSRKSFSFSNFIFTVRFPFYECLPKLSLNGV